jgi:hypothetical protein
MIYQDKIRAAFERHQISAEIICRIVPGLNPTGLSRFMNKNISLPESVLVELMQTIADLDKIAGDAVPYNVPWNDPTAVRKMIDDYRSGVRFIPVPIGGEPAGDFETDFESNVETKQ